MFIATVGAFAIGEFPEAVAVMLFYRIGEFFQDMAVNSSRRSISSLMDIRPDYANLKEGNSERKVSPEDIQVGQIIIIKPGEKLTFEDFLSELYQHFGIVIGVKQMQEYQSKTDQADVSVAYFKENELAFKDLIKNCGYLKELSDATSIVFNPYEREEI
jgi:hypothetical protein